MPYFAKDFGIDCETAHKFSCTPGGGMVHSGNPRGAVTGAIIVIGINFDQNLAAKDQTYDIANTLMKEFLRWKPSLNCADLIGHNLFNPHDLDLARERKLFQTKCAKFVRDAGEILVADLVFF